MGSDNAEALLRRQGVGIEDHEASVDVVSDRSAPIVSTPRWNHGRGSTRSCSRARLVLPELEVPLGSSSGPGARRSTAPNRRSPFSCDS